MPRLSRSPPARTSANGMVRPCSWPLSARRLAGGTKRKEHAMSGKHNSVIAAIGIDIGKNSFHVVGLDCRGAIALRQKWVAWPGGSTPRQHAGLPDRHGGLCRCPSSEPPAQIAWPRCPADAGATIALAPVALCRGQTAYARARESGAQVSRKAIVAPASKARFARVADWQIGAMFGGRCDN